MTVNELNNLSKEELIESYLIMQDQMTQLQRLIFGQRRERFMPDVAELPNLFTQNQTRPQPSEPIKEQISYERKKAKPSDHKGRQLLSQCAHLPIEKIELPMQQDVSNMIRIGQSIQEKIAFKPGQLYVKQYIRPKYKDPVEEKIIIADPVSEPIAKCEADISLLVFILICKFADHLPEYRIIEILKRSGLKIPASTINGWTHGTIKVLSAMGNHLLNILRSTGYIQVDETRIRVQDGERVNSTHLGYMWYYYSPEQKIVLINYEQNRGRAGPANILKQYHGYIQTDGYEVYKSIAKEIPDIVHVGCMAHLRRYYQQALDQDQQKASYVLEQIQLLYDIERTLKQDHVTIADRFAVRQELARPILDNLHLKIQEYALTATPKSTFGKTITYSLNNWSAVRNYISNGRLEIDNNQVENKIRPIAIGRKNYLFAGSHDAAQRLALIYSIIGTCKANEVNPEEYLNWLLPKISDAKITDLDSYTPMAYKKLIQST